MSTFTRKRAPNACEWCHARKIRCDVTIFGKPCTRCRQDDKNCFIRRKPHGTRLHQPPRYSSRSETLGAEDLISDVNDHAPRATELNHVCFSSYEFIELNEYATMTSEDLEFLNSKGCLNVPAPAYVDEFVRQYFLQIQPCIPVIDESHFWKLYRQEHCGISHPGMSLLLFQAILFASSPYISVETARLCGFENRRIAWNTLYQRVKILYHFLSDTRAIDRAHTALLLSLYTSESQPQIASLWLTHAIHAASEVSHNTVHEDKEIDGITLMKTRLWWSILVRDRSLSLGLRRPPQVSYFNNPILAALPQEDCFKDEINGSQVYDSSTKVMLFRVFRGQCHLSALLTEMLSTVFSSHGLSVPTLPRDSFLTVMRNLIQIDSALQLWKRESPLFYTKYPFGHSSVVKIIRLTMMYYETARMELAHYKALLIEQHRDYVTMDYSKHLVYTRNMLQDAIDRLIALLEWFTQKGEFQILPLAIVAHIPMPLIISAIDFKLSATGEEQKIRGLRLRSLSKLMSYSREVYDVAQFISSRTDDILGFVYLICRQVFLNQEVDISKECNTLYSSTVSDTALQAEKKRVIGWHDAFLRHTRAYLLITSTVDYFMSFGRLPSTNVLPALVCNFSPRGKINLPWSSHTDCRTIKEANPPVLSLEPRRITPESTVTSGRATISEQNTREDRFYSDTSITLSPDIINLDYFEFEPLERVLLAREKNPQGASSNQISSRHLTQYWAWGALWTP